MGNTTSEEEKVHEKKPVKKEIKETIEESPKEKKKPPEIKTDLEQNKSDSNSDGAPTGGRTRSGSGSSSSDDDNFNGQTEHITNSYENPIPDGLKNSNEEIKDFDNLEDQYKKKSFNEDDILGQKSPSGYKGIEKTIRKIFKVQDVKGKGNENVGGRQRSESFTDKDDYELNFYRNSEEIRKSYMEKLIYKRILDLSEKTKTHNSVIIFDWDDTLLCTSFLSPNGYFDEDMELTERDMERISKLEGSVVKLLELAVTKGDVYIITNAGDGWVEFSAQKFYPNVLPILKKVKIISARNEYESKYPGESRKWKIFTFLNLQKNMDIQLVTNIICLGDSIIELDAGKILASKFTQAYIKTIKFKESPKPEELNKQLNLVTVQFNAIVSAVKNLTIRVEKKKK